jgi:teichuronic acid biosynthesis glycosyltransferase TuaH
MQMHLAPDKTELRGRDIVIVGLQPWYFETGCNAKNIASLLAQHNRVLYVNFPLKRNAYFTRNIDPKLEPHIRVLRDSQEQIKSVTHNIWELYPGSLVESVNWLPNSTALRSILYLINNRNFARDIRRATKQLGFNDIILFNDNDIYNGYYLKEFLKPSLYIYYMRDFLQGYPYWKKHVSVLEPSLIGKSDLVVANSLYYAEYSRRFNPHTFYIGQGCDFSHFDASRVHAVPEDISALQRPLIGYIGALDAERLDLDILAGIARARPDWNIVLVGPEDKVFLQSNLHGLPNIHFTGGKPFQQLAAYVQAFDVCINPQLNNPITKGNYPLKIDEYLAMGKPVVATKTEAMHIFREHTLLARSPNEYPELIEKALHGNTPALEAERTRFAQTHSWDNCMTELYKAIQDTLSQPATPQ